MRRLFLKRSEPAKNSGQNIPKNRCRTTIAERVMEKLAELPLTGDQGRLLKPRTRPPAAERDCRRTRKDYQDVFDYLQPLESDLLADIKGTWVAAGRDAAFKAKMGRCCFCRRNLLFSPIALV